MKCVKFRFFLLVIAFALSSCNRSTIENVDDLIDFNNIYKYFNEIGGYNTVTLNDDETLFTSKPTLTIGERYGNENYLLGDIKQVVLFEEILYVLDSRQRNIKIFDLDGNWVETFDIRGRGPGETLYPEDIKIDQSGRKLVILDRMGQILRFNIDDDLNFMDQFDIKMISQSMCITEDLYVVSYRTRPEQGNEIETLGMYNKNSLELQDVIKGDYSEEHWLISRQISRGTVFCSETQDIYKSEWFIPRIIVYDKNNFNEKIKLLFKNLDLIRLELEYRDGTPVQTFDYGQYNQYVKNVIVSEDSIYLQIERTLQDRNVEVHSFRVKKNNLEADYLGITGFIHHVDEERVISSINDPFPQIIIFNK